MGQMKVAAVSQGLQCLSLQERPVAFLQPRLPLPHGCDSSVPRLQARWMHPVGSVQPRSPQLQHHMQVVFYTHIKCQALAKSQMKYNATAVAQCP